MSDRLSRKEIKRDEVLEGLARGVEVLQENARTIIAAVAAVVLVAVGWAIWEGIDSGREERANQRLAEALEAIREGGDDTAAARAELEAVLEAAGGTRAGSVAHATLGTLAARDGDVDAARRHWSAFLERHREHALAAQVERNLIALDRDAGDRQALIERLRASLAAGDSALSADVLLWELATTLEAEGRTTEALDAYGRLGEEHPNSPLAAQARERSAALESA